VAIVVLYKIYVGRSPEFSTTRSPTPLRNQKSLQSQFGQNCDHNSARNNSFESVWQDLSAWYPKVRIGGILAGQISLTENSPKAILALKVPCECFNRFTNLNCVQRMIRRGVRGILQSLSKAIRWLRTSTASPEFSTIRSPTPLWDRNPYGHNSLKNATIIRPVTRNSQPLILICYRF
jgi:hypothetical protein